MLRLLTRNGDHDGDSGLGRQCSRESGDSLKVDGADPLDRIDAGIAVSKLPVDYEGLMGGPSGWGVMLLVSARQSSSA